MLDREQLQALCALALAESKADQTEVVALSGETALTRYANNAIHQNVAEDNLSLSVRAVQGRRQGVASTNDPGPDALRHTVRQAVRLASLAPETPGFPGLPSAPPPAPGPEPSPATLTTTPEARAQAVAQVLEVAARDSLTAFGALSTEHSLLTVANSHGVLAQGEFTRASLSVVMQAEGSFGRAEAHSADVAALDAPALAQTAADKARGGRDPRALPPGRYTVVLEPLAVADLLMWLGFYGFNAQMYQEGRSFLSEKLGQAVADARINLWDDGLDPRGLPQPFDFEGVPKQRVPLIENGVAVGMVHDSRTAAAASPPGVSTGHALPAPNSWGPVPTNLFLAPGDSDPQDLLRSTDRGVLVTRFHYTNMVHPVQTVLTGMTRDGTFLLEGGEVVGGVKNLRFTQSLLETLAQVELIGNAGTQFEYAWVPALKVGGFNFTGATD